MKRALRVAKLVRIALEAVGNSRLDRDQRVSARAGRLHFACAEIAASHGLKLAVTGQLPRGPMVIVANHLSYLDSFVLGIPAKRPLYYVARSTLFFPPLGALIRSVGGFPIQREGMGASGLKETLRRLRNGGVVILFPEGTRSPDGSLQELKSGIAVLAARAKVPILPAAVAGTFEGWPRNQKFPRPHPGRVEYGPAIQPEELVGLRTEAITALIRDRIDQCRREAVKGLARDLGTAPRLNLD